MKSRTLITCQLFLLAYLMFTSFLNASMASSGSSGIFKSGYVWSSLSKEELATNDDKHSAGNYDKSKKNKIIGIKNSQSNLTDFICTTPPSPELFSVSLFYYESNGHRRLADGVTAVYNTNYCACLDGEDAVEIANWDENIAISRLGYHLALESRPIFAVYDTLPLFINHMNMMSYELQFDASNFSNTSMPVTLIDNFTGLHTRLSVSTTTVVPFSVTSVAGSYADNRFMVIFGPTAGMLPITFNSVNAFPKGKGIEVEWVIQEELNIDKYELERSADGSNFSKVCAVASFGNSSQPVNYDWLDASPFSINNFYRIKAIERSGQFNYSAIVKVNNGKGNPGINVYPNPITGNSFALQLNNFDKGNYSISFFNVFGGQVLSTQIRDNGGSLTQTIELFNNLPKGNYYLRISGNGINMMSKVIKN